MSKWGLRVEKPCGWCGHVMGLKPSVAKGQTYCSRSCALRARAKREGKNVGGVQSIICRGCGSQAHRKVRKHKDSGEFCSRECYTALKIRLSGEKAALRRIAVNWAVPIRRTPSRVQVEIAALRRIAAWAPGRTPTVRPCGKCGARAIGLGNYSRMCRACAAHTKTLLRRKAKSSESYKAGKRASKARRRAVERGVTAERIDPIKVFDRDGWKCHLCGVGTPRRLRGTYKDRAPELDHVVPLAAGGAHTWGNVKCACRKCNADKADKPLGQLGLGWAA